MHEHKECEHELQYCRICDMCYCEKCNKQWYKWNITYTQPYIAYYDGTIQWQTGTEIVSHSHGKDLE